jgi:hypothetical protein
MKTVAYGILSAGLLILQGACSSADSPNADGPSTSEVATSVVSGALNNNDGSAVAMRADPPKASPLDRVLDAINPIGTAWAADWSCTGGTLAPAFAGPGSYQFTPRTCSVTWDNGKSASSAWSVPFTLEYGAQCDAKHGVMESQAAGCTLTRTTTGSTRTVTGPDGNSYAITHDTDGAGTGWDPSVSPAPGNGGVELTCGAGGCATGKNLVINGSHLTGTVTIRGKELTIWDHTVSTGSTGLTVSGAGSSRVVDGQVTVEHNLLKYTASTTFNGVGYGEIGCCFPTTGSVSTTFSSGDDAGKTETLAFSSTCGDATLTKADGETQSITLEHCL